jgi:nitroreductase
MNMSNFLKTIFLALVIVAAFFVPVAAVVPVDVITLPASDKSGGMPLMRALNERKSLRAFTDEAISQQDLSNLLWAAFGINRADGRRTAPTARNSQQVRIYAAMANGVWLYDAAKHALYKVLERDVTQNFHAPLTLVYAVADDKYGPMHAGAVFQNVGLYCASAGLGNVVKAQGVNVLTNDELKLPADYAVVIVQSVGRPR